MIALPVALSKRHTLRDMSPLLPKHCPPYLLTSPEKSNRYGLGRAFGILLPA
jgi:hypothetical protein